MAYKNIEDRRKYHRKYMREYRQWLREHNFCVHCKKQDAYTLAGRAQCFECTEKRRGHPLLEKVEENVPTEPKIPRHERFYYGLCYICGKPLDGQKLKYGDESHLCSICYEVRKKPQLQKPFPPFANHPAAVKVYQEQMARYEKRQEEIRLRKAEKELQNLGKSTRPSG
jgi:hypothetical protein